MLYKKIAASIFILATTPSIASAYDPDGFHGCILDNVKEGMIPAAILAVREACAHQNNTTIRGGKKPPTIAEDSFIKEFKRENAASLRDDRSCQYPLTIDQCIVFAIRDAWYPSRDIEEVREWLYRSQSEHGPIPPKEN